MLLSDRMTTILSIFLSCQIGNSNINKLNKGLDWISDLGNKWNNIYCLLYSVSSEVDRLLVRIQVKLFCK